MPQVAAKLTPSNPAVVLGAMAYAYRAVTGDLPPSFNAILLPTAQSAFETSAWKAMWNNNAGNVTTAKPNSDNWIDLSGIAASTRGIKFKAYANLGVGCVDLVTWLQKHGALASAAAGDVGAYTNALQAGCYAGCDADYGAYASAVYGYTQKYANVVPKPYSPGLGLVPSLALGATIIGVAGLAAYALLPERTLAHLGLAAENPIDAEDEGDDKADEESDDHAEETGEEQDDAGEESEEGAGAEDEASVAEVQSTHVQTLLFNRSAGWTIPKARAWIRSHPAYHVSKIDETESSIRFRQVDPKKFKKGSFRTIVFGKGIKAVIGKRRTV